MRKQAIASQNQNLYSIVQHLKSQQMNHYTMQFSWYMKPKDSNGFIQHQSVYKCYLSTISAHHLELVYSSFGVRYGSRYHRDRRCEILTPLWGLRRVRVHVEVVSGPDVFDL